MPESVLPAEFALYKAFGEALAIGMLVGIERYKSRGESERKSAGVRTFAVIALLGAVSAVVALPAVALVTFAGLLLFLAMGYWAEVEHSLGSTTEIAALLTFWLGYLTYTHEALAVGTAIVLVEILAHKRTIHAFIRGSLSEVEFYDTLKFLLVIFVVYPMLPQGFLTQYEIIQPRRFWLLIILVSTISYSGYVLIRALGGRRGLTLNALVGGLLSTTAVTMSLAERARQNPELSRLFGVTAVMANAVQAPRLLVLVAAVEPQLARVLALPLLGMCAAGFLGALLLARVGGGQDEPPSIELLLANPYSFWPAAKFALMFVGVLIVSNAARSWLGEEAIYAVSAIAGLPDASAISLSVAEMFKQGTLSVGVAATSVLIAVAVNAGLKLVLAWTGGTRAYVLWLGGGMLTMVGTAAGLLAAVLYS